jgi:hypothetical protein
VAAQQQALAGLAPESIQWPQVNSAFHTAAGRMQQALESLRSLQPPPTDNQDNSQPPMNDDNYDEDIDEADGDGNIPAGSFSDFKRGFVAVAAVPNYTSAEIGEGHQPTETLGRRRPGLRWRRTGEHPRGKVSGTVCRQLTLRVLCNQLPDTFPFIAADNSDARGGCRSPLKALQIQSRSRFGSKSATPSGTPKLPIHSSRDLRRRLPADPAAASTPFRSDCLPMGWHPDLASLHRAGGESV